MENLVLTQRNVILIEDLKKKLSRFIWNALHIEN